MGNETEVTTGGIVTGESANNNITETNDTGNQQGPLTTPNTGLDSGGNEPQNNEPTEKTYSAKEMQAETDRRVAEAIKTAQAKWMKEYSAKLESEKAEAAKMAKMTTEERAKAEFDKRVKEFDEEREKYNAERLTFECTRTLAAENLPVEFAEMLTGSSSEETKKNIETFQKAFSNAIEAAVTERMKGNPPKKTEPNKETDAVDEFLKGFGI